MSEKVCEMCHDTGYYGDNGPGISRNNEYHECDHCEKGKALSHDAERRELAEKEACCNLPTVFLEAGGVKMMVEYFRAEKSVEEMMWRTPEEINKSYADLGEQRRIIYKLLEETK
jgi:hypothetical protein